MRCDPASTAHPPSRVEATTQIVATPPDQLGAWAQIRIDGHTNENGAQVVDQYVVTGIFQRNGDTWTLPSGTATTLRSWRVDSAYLKRERVNRRRYANRQEARLDVFDYIERFYNQILAKAARVFGPRDTRTESEKSASD